MSLVESPTITDEKLEEYLNIWDKLIDQGHRKMLEITLNGKYKWGSGGYYILTYGEERRELTVEQAWRVHDWLESLGSR